MTRWRLAWEAPCDDPVAEFSSVQVPRDTTDRLTAWPLPQPGGGRAMRVEVLQGDVAWNPRANGGAGAPIPGGWRAEVVGPVERQPGEARYEWSTMFDREYAADPRLADSSKPWQVVVQWHQGDTDQGGSPPVAFVVVDDQIFLDVHRAVSDVASVQVGQWPVAGLDRGVWHDFAAEITWHPTDGAIKLWHDGARVTFDPVPSAATPGTVFPPQSTDTLTGLATLFPTTRPPASPSVYLKVGLYRRAAVTTPAQTFVVFHDGIRRYVRTR